MHTLICGVTESGKTTLARAICRGLLKKKIPVMVRDPVLGTETAGGGWGDESHITSNQLQIFEEDEDFFSNIYEARGHHVFIDEAADVFSVGDKDNQWILRKGRHKPTSISAYLICQRPKMVAPNARTMCSRAYVFRLAADDLTEIGKDFGFSNLGAENLDRGDFLILESGCNSYKRANIFDLLGCKNDKPVNSQNVIGISS